MINLAQIVQSHALSFFHLSSPDLLLGMDAHLEKRNIFGVTGEHPGIRREGIRLRKFGQELIERSGGRADPPGVDRARGRQPPPDRRATRHDRERIPRQIPGWSSLVERNLDWFKGHMEGFLRRSGQLRQLPFVVHGAGR